MKKMKVMKNRGRAPNLALQVPLPSNNSLEDPPLLDALTYFLSNHSSVFQISFTWISLVNWSFACWLPPPPLLLWPPTCFVKSPIKTQQSTSCLVVLRETGLQMLEELPWFLNLDFNLLDYFISFSNVDHVWQNTVILYNILTLFVEVVLKWKQSLYWFLAW